MHSIYSYSDIISQHFIYLINKILYFIHIPKTAGSALISKHIINLGHGFNVPNIYKTPASKGGFWLYRKDRWKQYKYEIKDHYKYLL